jgi:hypothetical protein
MRGTELYRVNLLCYIEQLALRKHFPAKYLIMKFITSLFFGAPMPAPPSPIKIKSFLLLNFSN